MSLRRWHTLRTLFEALSALPAEECATRLALLDIDDDLRAELATLLAADATPATILRPRWPERPSTDPTEFE
ncbi:MAG: hypothetical protein RhofKO_18920 [Rhodothermales bacterium]